MRINIKTDSKTREVLISIKNLDKNAREGLREGFEKMGSGLVRTFQNSILNEPKYGREYMIKQSGVRKLHRASAPKQTPALLTGNYFESIYSKPNGSLGLVFGNTAEYAKFLELGTDKMKPRPGLKNAITSSLRNSRRYLEDALDKNLKS